MARRKKVEEADIRKRIRAGFGAGDGPTYKPWETVHTFSSRGNSHRIYSPKTGRVHSLFSNIERALFLKAEYGRNFVDFQEQRAMEREQTLAFARALGIKHSVFIGTSVPFVMTLDSVVVRRDGTGNLYREAYDAKESTALLDPRVLEKLSIHRMYCEHHGWKHSIVTDDTFNRQVIRNLEWIRAGARKPLELESVEGFFDELPAQMLYDIRGRHPRALVRDYCAEFDARYGLRPGSGLRVMQLLLWNHKLEPNLSAGPIHFASVASLLPEASNYSHQMAA